VSNLVVKISHLNLLLPTVLLIFCIIDSLVGTVTHVLLTMIGMCEKSAVMSKEQIFPLSVVSEISEYGVILLGHFPLGQQIFILTDFKKDL
jgi:hypothetical protein